MIRLKNETSKYQNLIIIPGEDFTLDDIKGLLSGVHWSGEIFKYGIY